MYISTSKVCGKAQNTQYTTVEITDDNQDELLEEVFTHDWCPAVFKGGKRSSDNFFSCDFLYGDVDNVDGVEITLQAFHAMFSEYEYITCTSKSHRKEKISGGKKYLPADRFHFLFPLDKTATNPEAFSRAMQKFNGAHPFLDPSAKDRARFFYGTPDTIIGYNHGKRMTLAEWGGVSEPELKVERVADEAIPDFLKTDGPTGLEGVDDSVVYESLSSARMKPKVMDALTKAKGLGLFDDYDSWYHLGFMLRASGFTREDYISLSNDPTDPVVIKKWDYVIPKRINPGSLVIFIRKYVDPDFFKKELKKIYKDQMAEKEKANNEAAAVRVAEFHATESPAILDEIVPEDRWFKPHTFLQRDSVTGQIRTLPKSTDRNLAVMLDFYRIKVWENLMTHKIEIEMPGVDPTDHEGSYANDMSSKIGALAKANNMSKVDALDYLVSIARKNKRHPFRDWVEGYTWDGKDRVKELYDCIVTHEEYDRIFGYTLLRKWLISQIAMLYEKVPRTRGVLTFQGEQSKGKTSFFKSLYPDGFFGEGLHLDPHSKDSVELAISKVCSELGELESSFKKDMASLKAFLTASEDSIRFAYSRRKEDFPRRSVFCATVNDEKFLIDDTGNTRFWVIRVIDVNYKHTIDIGQLWAQVKKQYEEKRAAKEEFIWWLSPDEEDTLSDMSEPHREVNVYEEGILTYFDPTQPCTQKLTNVEIAKIIGFNDPGQRETKGIASWLRNSKVFEPTTRHGYGHACWLMPTQKSTADIEKERWLKVVDITPPPPPKNRRAVNQSYDDEVPF